MNRLKKVVKRLVQVSVKRLPNGCQTAKRPNLGLSNGSIFAQVEQFRMSNVAYVMPTRWPRLASPMHPYGSWRNDKVSSHVPRVKASLDYMSNCNEFASLVMSLISDASWYERHYTFWSKIAPKYDGPNEQFTVETSGLFQAATILAKMILHFCYDLQTGTLLTKRIALGLWYEHQPCNVLDSEDHFGIRCMGTHTTFLLTQCLHSMLSFGAELAEKNEDIVASTIAHAQDDHMEPVIQDTTAFALDAFIYYLRSFVFTSTYIQGIHIDLLKRCSKPARIEARTRTLGLEKKPRPTNVWNNYLFDIVIMWKTIAQFRSCLKRMHLGDFLEALKSIEEWTMSLGLVGSSYQLYMLEKNEGLKAKILDLHYAAVLLHWCCLRMIDIHKQAFPSRSTNDSHAHFLDLQRSLWQCFVCIFDHENTKSPRVKSPNVGTGVLLGERHKDPKLEMDLFPRFTYTYVSPASFGLYVAEGVFMTVQQVFNITTVAGILAENLHKTNFQMWNAMYDASFWTPEVVELFPVYEDMRSMFRAWYQKNVFAIDFQFFLDLSNEYLKVIKETKKNSQKNEIESIMKAIL